MLFPAKLHSDPYSRISSDVAYEQGKFIDQWSIKYFDLEKQEYAMLKVRFSPLFKDVVEFDVELSQVPLEIDRQGKDITVNWHMYDNFTGN